MYLHIHKRLGHSDEVYVTSTTRPLWCLMEVPAQVMDRNDRHSPAIRRIGRGHPQVVLAHRCMFVLLDTHEHELTFKCGPPNPLAQACNVLVGVGDHDEIPNPTYAQLLGEISTGGDHIVAEVVSVPVSTVDGDLCPDDLGPPIVVVCRNPPQACLH
jgi:hypothetical protein